MINETDPYAHYEQAAEQLRVINKRFTFAMWLHIGIALLASAVGVFVTSLISSNTFSPDSLNEYNYDKGTVFLIEYSVSLLKGAGFTVLIVLFALLTVILGFCTAAKFKGAAIALTVLYFLAAILFTAGQIPYFWLYLILCAVGIGYQIMLLRKFKALDELQALPGYPHFNRRLSDSEKPREEVDLSATHSVAPMDTLESPQGMMPLEPMRSLDHLMLTPEQAQQMQKKKDSAPLMPDEHQPVVYEDPVITLQKVKIKPVSLEKPADLLPRPNSRSMYDGIPEEEKEALPTLEEIRARYGQSKED